MSAPAVEPRASETVAIRTAPPRPRRLSRKVLLGAALVAGAIISIAVIIGLSSPAPEAAHLQQDAGNNAGAPASIAEASSQYDAADLPRHDMAPPDAPSLTPPRDPAWSAPASGDSPAATAHAGPDPEAAARSAPILFSAFAPGSPANASVQADAAVLAGRLTPPRSRYEIEAGSIIPAALLTGLNSDAPGQVIAQVTANVFDSVTGEDLLIPQGARLIGVYDNGVRYGDQRIVLNWTRLILPTGWSIDLAQMPGTDPTGAAGVSDLTDNHLWRLGGAVGLSAIISVIANNSQNDRHTQSLSQSVGDAAAQQAAQTGSQIVGRELAVHPTLRIRPGANVRVLVTRDIVLRPYRAARR